MTQPRDYDERKRKPLRVTGNGLKRLLPSTPSEPLPVLPDELIREILLRLPARSLLKFRSVCSSRRTLISSSQFANDHARRSIDADPFLSEPRAFCHPWYNHKRFGDFSVRGLLENPFEPTQVVLFEGRHKFRIIGSCNGLLCLLDFDDNKKKRAMLWNPCTGLASQSLELGDFSSLCGFGYDHVNDKYKLFGIVKQTQHQNPLGSETRIFTFCPKPSSRRTIQEIAFSRILGDGKGIFVPGTGTLNWIGCHDTLDCFVISLDLVKETFSEFSLPLKDPDNKTTIFPHLCVLKNCLASCFHHRKTHWSVWVMKEYGVPQSWTELAIIPRHPPVSGDYLRPLYIWGNDVLAAVASSSKLVRYNLDDSSFGFPAIDNSRDGILEPTLSNSALLCFHIYHESLVSPPSYGDLGSSSSQMRLIKASVQPPF